VIKASSENENIKEPDEQSLVREDRKAEVVSANTKEINQPATNKNSA
jgi:hypothetical protein